MNYSVHYSLERMHSHIQLYILHKMSVFSRNLVQVQLSLGGSDRLQTAKRCSLSAHFRQTHRRAGGLGRPDRDEHRSGAAACIRGIPERDLHQASETLGIYMTWSLNRDETGDYGKKGSASI